MNQKRNVSALEYLSFCFIVIIMIPLGILGLITNLDSFQYLSALQKELIPIPIYLLMIFAGIYANLTMKIRWNK